MALESRYRTREVAKLEGISKRTLYERVKDKTFPPPDEPHARHGAPDYWYASTLERAREERQARVNACRQESAAAA